MNWFLLTALSVVFRAIYGVLTKVLSNKAKVSVYTQAMMLPLAAGVIALIFSSLLGGLRFNVKEVDLLIVALVVLGQGLGNIAYFAAIASLTNATAQISFSSILIFNTILSLMFFNLHLSLINVLGLILLMTAIMSVVVGKIEFNKKGVALMILAAFLFSIFQLSSAKMSSEVEAAVYLVIAYFGASLTVFIFKWKIIIKDLTKAQKISSVLGWPFLTAIPSLGNFIFAYYAYRVAPEPAKVAMLLTSQVVLAVLLSYFFLRERQYLGRKILAAMVVVMAAFLIKM